jgi:hypothetical protein
MRKATRTDLSEADRLASAKVCLAARIVLLTAIGCGTMELPHRTGTSKTLVWLRQESLLARRGARPAT